MQAIPQFQRWCSVLAVLVVAGCATNDDYSGADDFGDSVRHTIALQTETAGSAGTGLDAAKAQRVMAAYRQDVAKPQRAERDIVISVGD